MYRRAATPHAVPKEPRAQTSETFRGPVNRQEGSQSPQNPASNKDETHARAATEPLDSDSAGSEGIVTPKGANSNEVLYQSEVAPAPTALRISKNPAPIH